MEGGVRFNEIIGHTSFSVQRGESEMRRDGRRMSKYLLMKRKKTNL